MMNYSETRRDQVKVSFRVNKEVRKEFAILLKMNDTTQQDFFEKVMMDYIQKEREKRK